MNRDRLGKLDSAVNRAAGSAHGPAWSRTQLFIDSLLPCWTVHIAHRIDCVDTVFRSVSRFIEAQERSLPAYKVIPEV